ncbi:hypothetical protein QG516_21810 [Pedobacter gandavensis]|uniref:hypothetical protein n=1 Tax=Pedobacter TaxID=84567 RepID=UPI001C9A2847|nr:MULTISPECIES: hypothetical protein [Pedobacter]WGQ09152.1 hypothetical protein QG516_21810 [Pedobacter gandavensis]
MKLALYILIAAIAVILINFWYQVYVTGRYYASAGSFFTIIGALIPIALIYISFLLIKRIKNS